MLAQIYFGSYEWYIFIILRNLQQWVGLYMICWQYVLAQLFTDVRFSLLKNVSGIHENCYKWSIKRFSKSYRCVNYLREICFEGEGALCLLNSSSIHKKNSKLISRQLRARRVLMLFKDVPWRIRRVLLLSRPPTQVHKGVTCAFPFSQKRGVFWGLSLGKISQESLKRVFFAIANGNQYPR